MSHARQGEASSLSAEERPSEEPKSDSYLRMSSASLEMGYSIR